MEYDGNGFLSLTLHVFKTDNLAVGTENVAGLHGGVGKLTVLVATGHGHQHQCGAEGM